MVRLDQDMQTEALLAINALKLSDFGIAGWLHMFQMIRERSHRDGRS